MMADRLDDRQTKESCPSPRPMAFTVDFGPSEGQGSDQEKKKLALRDRIGRFAPAKSKKPALVVAPVQQQQQQQPLKDNTNHLAAAVKDEVMLLDEENNIKNDIEAEEEVAGDHGRPRGAQQHAYGKERPAVSGSNEGSWEFNRRAATVLN